MENPLAGQDGEGLVHGKVVGIIYPPPNLRAIVLKTADYVARNGPEFESKILNSDASNQKFQFLLESNPYNAYYRQSVAQFKAGKTMEEISNQMEEDKEEKDVEEEMEVAAAPQKVVREEDTLQRRQILGPIAKAAMNIPEGDPPKFIFKQEHPDILTPEQVDIIKLTAQYTAVGGREFLAGVANKEHRNPVFDFLKPTNAFFGYFAKLVESYTNCLSLEKAVRERLTLAVSDPETVLTRAVWRLDRKHKREEAEAEAANRDNERIAYQSIDWHDFSVVETIEFEDEAAPMAASIAPVVAAVDDDMDMEDDDDMDMVEDAPRQPRRLGFSSAPIEPVPAETIGEGGIRVRTDYVPQATVKDVSTKYFADPRTGKRIPIDQAAEHMRVGLLSKKYKVQKDKEMEKFQTTPYAGGDAIGDNLKRLASKRKDIFGGAEDPSEDRPQEPPTKRARQS